MKLNYFEVFIVFVDFKLNSLHCELECAIAIGAAHARMATDGGGTREGIDMDNTEPEAEVDDRRSGNAPTHMYKGSIN